MDDVRETLDRLIRENRDDYSGLSKMLGRNAAYIQQFIKRGTPRKLDPEDRRKLASFYGIDEAVLGGPPPTGRDGMVEVPVLDVNVSAGHGALATSEDRKTRFSFDENWLRKLTPARDASLSVVRVMGDSMEPTLSDGDDVLVDASDHGSRLRDGIYVIRVDDTLVVKRIALRPDSPFITIASDNPAYPTWDDVDRSTIHIAGRVLWFGRSL
ncbi:S24 family peptidase [Parasphingorhabdus sp.]|uniref:S24 family peptidase n=1 Tax=Parasphingorhabdus sp. TaxID=2709688 RepID=UPI002F92FC57